MSNSFTLEQLAQQVGGQPEGDPQVKLTGVAGLEEAGPEDVSFLANPQYERFLKTTRAGAVILGPGQPAPARNCLRVANPYLTFARVVELFHPPDGTHRFGISDQAWIDETAQLGPDAQVLPGAFIAAGARIGARVRIFPGAFIDRNVEIGDDSVIYPNVTLYTGARLGKRVIVHAGAVIASDGFGYARRDDGSQHKIPQVGRVIVEDDVEIGANTTIDRAALGETRIGRGTKIDNQVMIAHNVRVGEDCLLISQVGVSGSSQLGDRVVLAGQVGLVGHIEVGSDAIVGAQSGVSRSLDGGQVYLGAPAVPIAKAKKQYALISRLPKMREQLQQARQQIEQLARQLAALEAQKESE